MKSISWVTPDGHWHKALVRDTDTPDLAEHGGGLSLDPPDVKQLDWPAIARDLHNQLLARGLVTYQDVMAQQSGVTAAIIKVLRKRVLLLYRRL